MENSDINPNTENTARDDGTNSAGKASGGKPDVWGFIKRAAKRYFIDALGAMALGLFASLIIGLIISQLSKVGFLVWLAPLADVVKSAPIVGAAIGVAVAWGLKTKPLVMFASAAAGAIGYAAGDGMGGPVGAYLAAVVGAELGNLVAGRTPVDIVVIPITTIVSGGLVGTFAGPGVGALMSGLGSVINEATMLEPIPMGIVVSVIMGLALTAPISSAAIAISLGLNGIAAGAAAVGCSAQMVGFAVASYRDNKVGGLISQGIGTSMLQFPNIMRKPVIWLAPTLASAILGPISTAVLGMTNTPGGAGMGTSGLVGQFGAYAAMSEAGTAPWVIIAEIVVMHIIAPAALTLLFTWILRRIGWIKDGDMKLVLGNK